MKLSMRFALLLGWALMAHAVPASAQPVEVPDTWGGGIWTRPRLTGSWAGVRDELGKKGVVLDVDLYLTPQVVMAGGREHDAEFWGNAEYTLHVDTQKLGLWPGGFFELLGGTSFGDNVWSDSGTLPANTLPLVPLPNDPSSGLMNATFMQFLSSKFGPMSLDLVPISAYGGGVIALPWEGVTLSALVVDPSGTVENNDVSEAFDDGVMVLATGVVEVKPFSLVGHQKAGVMWSDKKRLSLDQDPTNIANLLLNERFPILGDPGPILEKILERFFPELIEPTQPPNRRNDTWAMFYSFDQYLWQPEGDPESGIGLFFTFGASDGKVNPVRYSYMLGIGGNGVVPGRPDDTFGVAWARTEFTDEFVPFLRQQLPLGLDYEDAVEICYSAAITPWLNATLDLQVIEAALESKLTSSGLEDVDTAVIGGLRLTVQF